jgi:hypothetical protein
VSPDINGKSLRKYLTRRLTVKMHFSRLSVAVIAVAASAMMLYSLLCRCRRRRVRIRYPGIRPRTDGGRGASPTVIEIGPADTVSRIAGELFAGSRSSERRIKGERARCGESGGNYNRDVYRRRRRGMGGCKGPDDSVQASTGSRRRRNNREGGNRY